MVKISKSRSKSKVSNLSRIISKMLNKTKIKTKTALN